MPKTLAQHGEEEACILLPEVIVRVHQEVHLFQSVSQVKVRSIHRSGCSISATGTAPTRADASGEVVSEQLTLLKRRRLQNAASCGCWGGSRQGPAAS